MRTRDPGLIEFWRPMIWHTDVALQSLLSFSGKLYRGIDCHFDDHYSSLLEDTLTPRTAVKFFVLYLRLDLCTSWSGVICPHS